jgi:hypothetical protein
MIMKKILIFIGGFVAGALIAFFIFTEPNDIWHYHSSNWVGNDFVSVSKTIEFGNGNYVLNSRTSGGNQARKTEIGTFTVSGDSIILTPSDGEERVGIIVGSSLTIDGRTFR